MVGHIFYAGLGFCNVFWKTSITAVGAGRWRGARERLCLRKFFATKRRGHVSRWTDVAPGWVERVSGRERKSVRRVPLERLSSGGRRGGRSPCDRHPRTAWRAPKSGSRTLG